MRGQWGVPKYLHFNKKREADTRIHSLDAAASNAGQILTYYIKNGLSTDRPFLYIDMFLIRT